MDARNIELLGVAQQKKAQTGDIRRKPLVSSEKSNAVPAARMPRMREISSRYKPAVSSNTVSTPAAAKRCPSPNAGRTSPGPVASLPKRARSAERRRPSTPTLRHSAPLPMSRSSRPSTPCTPSSRPTTPVRDSGVEIHSTPRKLLSGRAHDGLWPSMWSLTASFQSESVSIPVCRNENPLRDPSPDRGLKSPTCVGSERTPLKGRNVSEQSENSRPADNSLPRVVEQHRWPGISGGRLSTDGLARSMDLTHKANISVSLPVSTQEVSPRRTSVSDSTGRGLQKSTSEVSRQVPLKGRGRLDSDVAVGVNVASNPSERAASATHSSRTQSSPLRGFHRSSAPNKTLLTSSSTTRGPQSPSRTRPSTPFSSCYTRGPESPSRTRPSPPFSSGNVTARSVVSSSALNYIGVRKWKKSTNQTEDVQQLRLLYNRNLQWCFINALSDAVSLIQKIAAEKTLYNVWNATSEVRDSAILKRINLQHVKEEMKLNAILQEQMSYLKDWTALERDHSSSLSAAIEALKAATLCVPVTGGARVNVCAVKNAVSSAVDVMQAMGSSICCSLSKVESMNHLASVLSDAANKEISMLEECRDLLASAAITQVQESSLRAQVIQLKQYEHVIN